MEAPCHAVMIQKKMVENLWKNEREKWKSAQDGKMYMKNNGTYFNLNKWIFVLQFTVLFGIKSDK
jgi:hypothetical protein